MSGASAGSGEQAAERAAWLREEIRRGGLDEFSDVVFWHTGGGFGVFAHDFSAALGYPSS